MFSLIKTILFAAALIPLVVANLPAPVHSSQLSQPYIKGTSKDAGSSSNSSISANALSICNHCYLGFGYLAPPGSKFLSFTGNIVVPQNNPDNVHATNYVWPGLQNDIQGNPFVLQSVVEGTPANAGRWTAFQNYLVGSRFGAQRGNQVPASVGQTLSFSMVISPDEKSWNIKSSSAANNYPIRERLPVAVFAGEFYNSNWFFGDLVFTNIKIVAKGGDSSWCVEGGNFGIGASLGRWEGLSVGKDRNGNTVCGIKKLTITPRPM